MKIEYFGHIKDGLLKITDRRKFDADMVEYFSESPVEIIIQHRKKRRSLNLNNYYWGIVVTLITEALRDLGNEVDKETTHQFLKCRFHYKEIVNEESGEVIKIPQTTTQMSNTEFMEYMEECKRFAAQFLNTIIPDPNEDLTLDL